MPTTGVSITAPQGLALPLWSCTMCTRRQVSGLLLHQRCYQVVWSVHIQRVCQVRTGRWSRVRLRSQIANANGLWAYAIL